MAKQKAFYQMPSFLKLDERIAIKLIFAINDQFIFSWMNFTQNFDNRVYFYTKCTENYLFLKT